jgi:hypothetical protein
MKARPGLSLTEQVMADSALTIWNSIESTSGKAILRPTYSKHDEDIGTSARYEPQSDQVRAGVSLQMEIKSLDEISRALASEMVVVELNGNICRSPHLAVGMTQGRVS